MAIHCNLGGCDGRSDRQPADDGAEGDGVDSIRKATSKAMEANDDNEVEIELKYKGAPNYILNITGPDYKRVEKALENVSQAAIKSMEDAGGVGKLIRD